MSDRPKARPVSGEIMTARPAARSGFAAGVDVIDVEYEVVEPAGARLLPESDRVTPPIALDGLDSLRQAHRPAAVGGRRGGPIFWSIGLALVAASFWVSGGHAVLRGHSMQAVAMQAPALRLVEVSSSVIGAGGKPVLKVDGAAINDGAQVASLPGIEIRVTGRDGRVTRYNLGTSDRSLAAGARFDFSSRLEVPKDGVKSIAVSFREGRANAGGEG